VEGDPGSHRHREADQRRDEKSGTLGSRGPQGTVDISDQPCDGRNREQHVGRIGEIVLVALFQLNQRNQANQEDAGKRNALEPRRGRASDRSHAESRKRQQNQEIGRDHNELEHQEIYR
jgi:hypothetical protein